jgi:16S rRNA processing protein RimM
VPHAGGSDLVVLGVVSGAHGIAGEVRVHPYNPESAHLASAPCLRLRDPEGRMRVHRVTRSRRHKQYFLLKLEGVDDRTAALAARGFEVLLPREELEATDEGEFYYHDLLGLDVVAEDGRRLGAVEEIFDAGASPVLVVRAPRLERMIPFTQDSIAEVSLIERRIVVRPGAGVVGSR